MARYDRDEYVTVHPENIQSDPSSQSQYAKTSQAETANYGTIYDYGSVMHYADGMFAWSRS